MIRGRRLGRRSNREYHERLSFPFLVTTPPSLSLAAICLPDQGPVFPSIPLFISSTTSAVADSQETRPPDTVPKRSPSQTAVRAQKRAALTHASVGEGGPPAVVAPVASPAPKRTAETGDGSQGWPSRRPPHYSSSRRGWGCHTSPQGGSNRTTHRQGSKGSKPRPQGHCCNDRRDYNAYGCTISTDCEEDSTENQRGKASVSKAAVRSRVGIPEHHRRV
jgi:hypothetical protein